MTARKEIEERNTNQQSIEMVDTLKKEQELRYSSVIDDEDDYNSNKFYSKKLMRKFMTEERCSKALICPVALKE